MTYLKRFPVDTIKIDQSFVGGIVANEEDRAIVSAIVSMAKALGLRVVAEGVETPDQLDFLREVGCDEYQGFLVSRPLAPKDFEELLRRE